mmetsp:Transcript_91617/g.182532  ORF Transcript_91617/g.182532 Transcript_91617/m.182532 type:complete len:179 (-) Transcript_91617:336-872(-)
MLFDSVATTNEGVKRKKDEDSRSTRTSHERRQEAVQQRGIERCRERVVQFSFRFLFETITLAPPLLVSYKSSKPPLKHPKRWKFPHGGVTLRDGALLPAVRAIASDPSEHVRASVASSVAALAPWAETTPSSQLLPVMLQFLRDTNSEVRLNVVRSLGDLHSVIGVDLLAQSLLRSGE